MWLPIQRCGAYTQSEGDKLFLWAKCGSSAWTAVPTLCWATGSVVIAYRVVSVVFKRFLFRRIPLWEQILQQLLFIWLVVYSLHFWTFLVHLVKVVIDYVCQNVLVSISDDAYDVAAYQLSLSHDGRDWLTQGILAGFGLIPLIVYFATRPNEIDPPLMIWITTNPWLRREMGPHGYYLNRPPSTELSDASALAQPPSVVRTLSDSKIYHKETVKKRRYSKSC